MVSNKALVSFSINSHQTCLSIDGKFIKQ